MGGTYIDCFIKKKNEKDFRKEMESIIQEDREYYGSNPYSGSWATIDSIAIIPDPFPTRKWTKKKYEEVNDFICDTTDKWYGKAVKTSTGFIVGAWAAT